MRRNLSAENVEAVFADCLFKDGEDTPPRVPAHGVRAKVGFHPGRLRSHDRDIRDMLADLPKEFTEYGGGGWSFLNACVNREEVQWAGLHETMDKLVCLGLASGRLVFLMDDRELWGGMPGGMPYMQVKTLVRKLESCPHGEEWLRAGGGCKACGEKRTCPQIGGFDAEVMHDGSASSAPPDGWEFLPDQSKAPGALRIMRRMGSFADSDTYVNEQAFIKRKMEEERNGKKD